MENGPVIIGLNVQSMKLCSVCRVCQSAVYPHQQHCPKSGCGQILSSDANEAGKYFYSVMTDPDDNRVLYPWSLYHIISYRYKEPHNALVPVWDKISEFMLPGHTDQIRYIAALMFLRAIRRCPELGVAIIQGYTNRYKTIFPDFSFMEYIQTIAPPKFNRLICNTAAGSD